MSKRMVTARRILTKRGPHKQIAIDRFYEKNGFYPSRPTLSKFGINVSTKDLYFVRCLETNRIKIGIANNTKSRFDSMQVGSPTRLKIDLVVPYAEVLEKFLHNKYKEFNVRGEWFSSNPGLELLISDFRDILWRQENKNN